MSIRKKLESMLVANGMFDDQAKEVLMVFIEEGANEPMTGRWEEPMNNYPPQLLAVLWLGVKRAALIYIDVNCPQAWFRPMFTDDPDAALAERGS